MAATLLEKQTEQPSLDLNLDRTVRPEAESGGPFWEGDRLKWIGIMNGDCSAYRALEPEIQCSLRAHLISFAHSGKYSAMSYHRAVKALNLSLAQYPTSLFDLAWLVKAITLPSFRSAKGTVESFFKYWLDRYPKAIAGDALQFLARPLALGRRPRNVLSDDPEKSWLTDLEYDTVLNSIWDNYDRGFIGTQSTLLRLLSMQYARRPVQLASLKIGDFRDRFEVGGSTDERCIYFPGAKDRDAKENFRDSKNEVHPVADHLWGLFQIQKHEIKALFEEKLGISITEAELAQLPVFTSGAQLELAVKALTCQFSDDWRLYLDSRLFHLDLNKVSKLLAWRLHTLGYNGNKDPRPKTPLSHRTGRPIKINANRLRHTRARQLARLGTPKHVLSFWLGHGSQLSIDAYYNDPAEEARQINEEMKATLVPLAMAFTGKLLDDVSAATHSNTPQNTLEFAADGDLRKVGICGKHSFCSTTSVPIPCYRCKDFEPLVHAPHDEVLHALLMRQAEENAMIKIGGNRRLLTPIDLGPDIRAVQTCIASCAARKAELAPNNHE